MKTNPSVLPEGARRSLRDSPERGWLMVLLITGMMICYAHRGALSIAAPFMIKELHISSSLMGVLLSAFFWSYAFVQMPSGWLVDRVGVRWSYGAGFVIWVVGSTATGFAGGTLGLILARMMMGVGQSVAFPASARAVANWFKDRERGVVTGGYLTGVRFGQALISSVGAYLLATHGLKYFFLIIGVIPLVWLFPWLLFLGRWEKRPVASHRSASSALPPPGASFLKSLALFRHRSVFGIFLGFFAYDYAWFVYVTWLPGYLSIERHFSPREMSIYSSVPYVIMSVIILLSGLLSDSLVRRGFAEIKVRRVLIMIGLAISCLIVPAGMVKDNVTAVWLLTLSLCGLGIAAPNTWTLTQAVCSRSVVGMVSGIQNFGGNLGGILAPALTGYIAHRTHSFALALSLTGVILIAGILTYGLLISRPVDVSVEE